MTDYHDMRYPDRIHRTWVVEAATAAAVNELATGLGVKANDLVNFLLAKSIRLYEVGQLQIPTKSSGDRQIDYQKVRGKSGASNGKAPVFPRK